MSEDDTEDDWFENAVDEGDDPSDWGETGFDADDDELFDADDTDSGASTEPFGEDGDDSPGGASAGTGNAFGGTDTDTGGDDTGDSPFGDGPEVSDSPFGDGPDGPEVSDSPFGGGATEEADGPFDQDFESAFGDAASDFDEEEFESDIPRIDLGIDGLDDMILGGVPARHLIVAIGGAGSGKTTFGLQFIKHGVENGENGVFITLEQSHDSIIDTAREHGWPFDRYEDEDALAVVDLDPVEMASSLENIRGELPELITDFDADRLVLDSVSLLEMMYEDQSRRRTEVFDFTRSLKKAGVTTFLTSEADDTNSYASRYGIIEYLTDAVFFLQYVRGETQETRLAVEIQKIRNANHSRERKPYEITDEGISVYQQANIF